MSMSNRQCAHVWAAQSRSEGKGYGNLYFKGPTIYSYGPHFPIATFTDKYTPSGLRIALFNDSARSITTSKHQGYVRSAIPTGTRVITVPHILPTETDHERNLEHLRAQFETYARKATRARTHGDHWTDCAISARNMAFDYARAFMDTELSAADWGMDLTDIAAALERAEAARAERAAKRRAKLEADFLADAALWREGAPISLYQYETADFPTLIRIAGDTFETSRGASVPVNVARNLWRLVTEARRNKRAIEFRGEHRVGDFLLRRVHEDGTLIIGCHKLEYPELERMARALGFLA